MKVQIITEFLATPRDIGSIGANPGRIEQSFYSNKGSQQQPIRSEAKGLGVGRIGVDAGRRTGTRCGDKCIVKKFFVWNIRSKVFVAETKTILNIRCETNSHFERGSKKAPVGVPRDSFTLDEFANT